MATDYISRDAASNIFTPPLRDPESIDFWEWLQSEIDDIPAADVRPVVFCGECKHWLENGSDYCSCDRDALLRERNFFCAGGEKREES